MGQARVTLTEEQEDFLRDLLRSQWWFATEENRETLNGIILALEYAERE